MISVDEAIKKVMENILPTPDTEEIDLMSASGRILAEDITSDIDKVIETMKAKILVMLFVVVRMNWLMDRFLGWHWVRPVAWKAF